MTGTVTGAVMQAAEYAEQVEEGVNSYISSYSYEVRMAKQRQQHKDEMDKLRQQLKEELRAANAQNCNDLEGMRKLYNSAAEATRKELAEKDRQLLEKDDTIQQLQVVIDGMREFHQKVCRHGANFRNFSDASSPESVVHHDSDSKPPYVPKPAENSKPASISSIPGNSSASPSDSSHLSTPPTKKFKLANVKRRFRLNRVSTSPQRKDLPQEAESQDGPDSLQEAESQEEPDSTQEAEF